MALVIVILGRWQHHKSTAYSWSYPDLYSNAENRAREREMEPGENRRKGQGKVRKASKGVLKVELRGCEVAMETEAKIVDEQSAS